MAADGKVQIDVELNDSNAKKGLGDIEREAGKLGDSGSSKIGKFGAALKGIAAGAAIGVAAVGGIAIAVGKMVTPMIQAAASAQALNSQFSQVFGEMESKATTALQKIGDETNIMPDRLKQSFTMMAAFAKTTGASTEEALAITTRATMAAADSAAFYDTSIETVTENLQSFLKGKVVAPL